MCLAQGQNDDDQCTYQQLLSPEQQLAVAVDYQANIAAAAQLLEKDWNMLWALNIQPNGYSSITDSGTSDPKYIDNWYMAAWAYNSGLEPGSPEKVLAWAFDSITLWDYSQGKYVQAFAYAHGSASAPPIDLFCTTSVNHCDASGVDTTKATGPDACQLPPSVADHCWWNQTPADTWPIQAGTLQQPDAGTQVITYPAGTAEPEPEPIAAQFAQTCASTLPSNAVIVGDGGQSALGCPGQNWTSQGSFTWNFAADSNGLYSSKIDFDQIGAGFGGHFWFGYARNLGARFQRLVPPHHRGPGADRRGPGDLLEGAAIRAPVTATKGAAPKTAKAAPRVTSAASAGWVPLNLPQGIPTTEEATDMLADLTRTRTQLSGYNMDASYWNFTTVNGCDTRQDVLRAQAVSPA
jgi:hypothetical protein